MTIVRILSLSFFTILFLSCKVKKNVFPLSEQKIQKSHDIRNNLILKPINEVIEKIKKEPLYDVIILKIDSISIDKQYIHIKPSNFQTEQAFCQLEEPCESLKGYLFLKNIPILLYGDLNMFFTKTGEPLDILKTTDKIELIASIHTPYYKYLYHKNVVYGDVLESIDYKGEVEDLIKNR